MEVYFLLFYYFRFFHFFQNQSITQNLVVYFGGFGGVLWGFWWCTLGVLVVYFGIYRSLSHLVPLTISPSRLATPSPPLHRTPLSPYHSPLPLVVYFGGFSSCPIHFPFFTSLLFPWWCVLGV